MDRGTLTHCVTAIAAEMNKAQETHEPFTLRDLHLTLETLLGELGCLQRRPQAPPASWVRRCATATLRLP